MIMDLHDIEGLGEVGEKRVFVTITHDYSLTKNGWLVIENDKGVRFILDHVKVEEDGAVSFHVFEFTQKGTKKGSYASYLPQVRDIVGYRDVPARREIIKYRVIGWEDRKLG